MKELFEKIKEALISALPVTAIVYILALTPLFNLSSTASDIANKLIIYHALVAAVIWPIAFALPSSFKAASDVKFTLWVSLFSMWVFRVALGYVFAFKDISLFGTSIPGLGLGIFGVWFAMTVDWVFRTILFAYRYLSGKWLTKYKG